MSAPISDPVIGQYSYIAYDDPAAVVRPWDARASAVADRLIALIGTTFPEGTAEHIGSTAIPGCHGKGVVDLMLLYRQERIVVARDAVDRLGFQRHEVPGAYPEDRPVSIGTIDHEGETFRAHVHILAEDAPEAARQRYFRDTLRADPALVAAHVVDKRRIATSGEASDGGAYADAKGKFIANMHRLA